MFTDKQQKIIDAAIELIAEKGIQKLTIKNLSAKVRVTEGAIYRHFKSKIDILLGILELFKEQKNDLIKNISAKKLSAINQLEIIFEEHVNQFVAKPALAAIIFAEEIFQNEKQLSETIVSIMETNQKIVEDIIEDGQKKGEIRNDISSEQLSLIVLGAIRLIVAKWHLFGYKFDLQKEGMELFHSIQKIIQK